MQVEWRVCPVFDSGTSFRIPHQPGHGKGGLLRLAHLAKGARGSYRLARMRAPMRGDIADFRAALDAGYVLWLIFLAVGACFGPGSALACVLRTASVSISRSSAFVFGGAFV